MSRSADVHGNVHGDDGRFVSPRLFERDRMEHQKDHEREQAVAKETAQRLEREVENTALRLERVVEETAVRIENAVRTALAAVGETARVHAEAHAKEHIAHERIHSVEKEQVDKAELAARENATLALAALNRRLDGMNEFRQSLEDFQSRSVSRDMFDQRTEQVNERLGQFDNFRSKSVGVGAVLVLVSGVIGAAIFKVLGG